MSRFPVSEKNMMAEVGSGRSESPSNNDSAGADKEEFKTSSE